MNDVDEKISHPKIKKLHTHNGKGEGTSEHASHHDHHDGDDVDEGDVGVEMPPLPPPTV